MILPLFICVRGREVLPHFRDPIHGFIEVSLQEQKIIDSMPFQRLRNIKQLATTYLVYHGAEHTRFGHSIGVMHLVTRTFDAVVSKNPGLFRDNPEENEIVVKWYRQILRLIALTHDLGHAPFSHASEALFPAGKEHEDYTKEIIESTEIAGYINEIGYEFQKQYGDQYTITPQLLWMIYGDGNLLDENYIWPDFMFLKSFMDGEMDCDKMDYLLRDSKFCGVSYGAYDLERFISTLTVYKRPEEKILQLAISSGGIQAFEEFVLARYFMFIQVYFHKTRRYFDHLLVECLKELLPDGKYPDSLPQYLQLDDTAILHSIKKSNAKFAFQYKSREVMTCIRETSAHADKAESQLFKVICTAVERALPEDAVFIDKVDKAAHKLQPLLLESDDDSGKGIKIIDKHTKETRNIMEDSLILEGIVKRISIRRLYVKKEFLDQANQVIEADELVKALLSKE